MFYTGDVMFKKFIFFIFLTLLIFVSYSSVKADCVTGDTGWITCDYGNGSQRAMTCDQLSGIGTETCGAGSGCGPTGCYNCASQGNCQGGGGTPSGNNCPAGQVWNDCASGTNTCVPGEKWNACKTGSNTITNCRQVPNCNTTCTDQGVWSDCTGGNNPTYSCWQESCAQYNCGWRQQCMDYNCGWRWQYVRNEGWEQYWGCDQYCSGDYWACDNYCWGGHWATCGGECRGWGPAYMHQSCNTQCNGTNTVCDGSNTCQGGYSWDNCANGGTNSCQGGCVNLPCNSVAPSTPGLTSPVSGAEVSGTETTLAGATASWGTACSGQNYQFNIYVQQCDAIMNPTTLWKTVTASGNNFNELFTGVGGKGYCWTAEATNGVTTSAKATAQRWTFSSGLPWWQVSGGSVMTFGGVTSLVGQNQQFIKDAPGVVISGTGNVFLNGQDASANKWVVTDGLLSQKVSYRYDYDYVSGRIISTIKPAVSPNLAAAANDLKVGSTENGVYYVQVTGNLDINGDLNFGSDKVVVLVTGDANIKGKINFTKNQGLFALYVKGNINIDPSIGTVSGAGINPNGLPTHLEGLYLAQGAINTGVAASQLRLEGAFIGIGGVNLQRKLNSAWPSEYFVFRPDILINLPKQLLRQNHIWQELAP